MASHKYLPQTEADIKEMLDACGLKSLDDLYSDVVPSLRMKDGYDFAKGKSEADVRKAFRALAARNKSLICFSGAGVYDHYVPSVADYIASRSEFLTSYTPYQAEISQGTLQYIFEYQSMMAGLTGMDVSNASLYDGATAIAEAVMMAVAVGKKKNRVLLSATLNPRVIRVVKTYALCRNITVDIIPEKNGVTDLEALGAELGGGDVAGVVLPQPNYYGIVEDLTGVAETIHKAKALMIMDCVPFDLALLRTPSEWGADIAAGSAQSLGLPMNFGGANLGFFCTWEKYLRKMPGRVVGATVDAEGRRAFCLTLQTREQHIRREKATSNICSNEGLQTLSVAIYLSLMGAAGLKEAASKSYSRAHYLHDSLIATGKFSDYSAAPFFNEFCLEISGDIDRWSKVCEDKGYFGGVKIDDKHLLLAVTELRTKEEMDTLVSLTKMI